MSAGRKAWTAARSEISALLAKDSKLANDSALKAKVLVAQKDVLMVLPAAIGDYTDFYASKEHATNVGTMFRDPANALLPNWSVWF
jgi:fumarylacetoacetase